MGNGCFKGGGGDDQTHRITPYVDQDGGKRPSSAETTPRTSKGASSPELPASSPELKAHIAPIVQAAGQSKWNDVKLDEVLCTLSRGTPSEVSGELMAWWGKASVKARAGLLELLKRVIGRSLDDKVTAAEQRFAKRGHDIAEADFGRLADLCREDLRMESSASRGVLAATLVISSGALLGTDNPEAHVVPALERIVLLFRHAFLAHIGSSASNLQHWRDFVVDVGLPPLDEHLPVLTSSSKAVMVSLLLIPEGAPPAPVIMKRDSTLSYVEKQLPEKSACVLSPYFESTTGTKMIQGKRVEGGEGHGPRKEFFFTASANSLKTMFEFHRGTGEHWFNGYANDLNEDRRSCCLAFGRLLVLAIANRCKISFTLPVLFFKLLLYRNYETSLADLQGFDNTLHSSLKKCLKMGGAQFKSLKEVEGCPASMTQEEYIKEKVKELLTPQGMLEIQVGFWGLAREKMMHGLNPNDLRTILCPIENHSADVNIRGTFKVVMEEELAECPVFVDAFWKVVDGLSKAEKRLFLVFVTGVEMPPEPGTEQLIIDTPFSAFSKDEHLEMLSKLPQAHTCTNTLELPNYHDALVESGTLGEDPEKIPPKKLASQLQRVLGEKLRLAINESKGYELDAIETAQGSTGASVPFSPASNAQTGGYRPLQEMGPPLSASNDGLRPQPEALGSYGGGGVGGGSYGFKPQVEASNNSNPARSQPEASSNSFGSRQDATNSGFRSHQDVTLPPIRQVENGHPKRLSPDQMTDELMRVSPTEELLRKSPNAVSDGDSLNSVSPVHDDPSTSLLLDEGNRALRGDLRELSTPSPQLQSASRPLQKDQGSAQHASIDDFLQECDDLMQSFQDEFQEELELVERNGDTPSGRIVPTPLLT